MAFLNLENYEIYNREIDMRLSGSNYIKVDDNIVLAVSLLNKKGYATRSSCSGHLCDFKWEDSKEENIKIKTVPYNKCAVGFHFPYEFKTLPEGFTVSKDMLKYGITYIKYTFKSELNSIERLEEIMQANLNLTKWAMELEPYDWRSIT